MSVSKRAFIIHGWGGFPEEGWFPWLKKELGKKGFQVQVPSMPDSSNPTIDAWISHLAKTVGRVDKHTVLVGHSIGCQTILRYLERLPKEQTIGGAVFVAGWFTLMNLNEEEKRIAEPWLTTPVDFEKIKAHCKKFIAIFSDDDPDVPLENKEKFMRLGAKTIVEHAKGHFRGDDGITELPVVLELVLSTSSN